MTDVDLPSNWIEYDAGSATAYALVVDGWPCLRLLHTSEYAGGEYREIVDRVEDDILVEVYQGFDAYELAKDAVQREIDRIEGDSEAADNRKPDASTQSIPSSVNPDADPVSSDSDEDDWPKSWDDICHQYDSFESVSNSHRVHLGTLYIEEGDDEWWPLKQYINAVVSGELE